MAGNEPNGPEDSRRNLASAGAGEEDRTAARFAARSGSGGGSVVHFSVYCDDEQRAMAFYGAVFGWRFEPWGPPGYHRILTKAGPGVCEGSLARRIEPRGKGAPNAFRCTISVANIDATLALVDKHGGQVDQPAIELPGIGRVAEFYDPEGNLACVMQFVPTDPRAEL